MIKATELQIGDYVLIDGKPRRVESITKKKVGYHINPQTDKRLYYARLYDVEPLPFDEARRNDPGELLIPLEDNVLVLDMRGLSLQVDHVQFSYVWTFKNILGDTLTLLRFEVHLLQHIIRNLKV